MRNLKKILALVLALVMSLSLMATASAADFTDADSINEKYETAIEVLEGLGVFKGYQDGTFQPTGSITRAETAAIIYRIVTGDVKDEQVGIYADYNIFTDVPSTSWFAGYVNFCANAEYIKGMPDGTFKPNQQVTGYAALAMILRAIGYTANGGFTGSDWEVQTARTAEARKITKNIMTGTLGQPASRETVAEILFQAILVNMVDHNVDNTFNGNQGYFETDMSLGYKTFKLEEIEGVVTGNEYADLNSTQVLPNGSTQLQVAGEDDPRDLAVTTKITDIGESRYAYITGTKVLAMGDTGKNKITQYGHASEIDTRAKFEAAAEMAQASDIEYYVNFGRTGTFTCDQRLEFNVAFYSAAAETSFRGYAGEDVAVVAAEEDGWVLEVCANTAADPMVWTRLTLIPADNGDYDNAIIRNGGYTGTNAYRFTKIVRANEDITDEDMAILAGIFGAADNVDNNANVVDKITGDVFVGTMSTNSTLTNEERDLSNQISYKKFVEEYINDETFDVNWEDSFNGDWVKFVDNDGDGAAEYAFYTWSWLDEAIDTYTNKSGDTVTQFNWFNDDATAITNDRIPAVRYLDNEGNDTDKVPAVGEKVVCARIDNQILVEPALSEEVTVTDYNWKDDEITVSGGTKYGQSFIENATDMQQLISTMADNTKYTVYFDHFGYIRAYEIPGGTHYTLLTEIYANNNQNGNLAQQWPMTVELVDKDADPAEYSLNGGSKSPFVSDYVWNEVFSDRGTYNYYNYLLPATAHYGVSTTGYAPKATVPTFDTTKLYSFWPKNNQAVKPINALTNANGSIFEYGSYVYDQTIWQGDATKGISQKTVSFTNVAVTNINDGTATLTGAAQLRRDRNGGIMWYDVNNNNVWDLGELPRYAVDYVELTTDRPVAGQTRYTIAADYDGWVGNSGNNYVSATHNTEYYIAYNGGVYYFTDYAKLPALTAALAGDIRAAYAVARDTSADDANQAYWVADVIVYEVEKWEDSSKTSTALVFYNPSKNDQQVQLLEVLDSKSDPTLINVIPDPLTWSADAWRHPVFGPQYAGYGFYQLWDGEKQESGELAVSNIVQIDGTNVNNVDLRFNSNLIYAGTVINEVEVGINGSYLNVDTDNDGISNVSLLIKDSSASNVYSITTDQKISSTWSYNEASALRYNNVNSSDIKAGDRVIWVGGSAINVNGWNNTQTAAFVVDLGNDTQNGANANWALRINTADFLLKQNRNTNIVAGLTTSTDTTNGLWQRIMAEQQPTVPANIDDFSFDVVLGAWETAEVTVNGTTKTVACQHTGNAPYGETVTFTAPTDKAFQVTIKITSTRTPAAAVTVPTIVFPAGSAWETPVNGMALIGTSSNSATYSMTVGYVSSSLFNAPAEKTAYDKAVEADARVYTDAAIALVDAYGDAVTGIGTATGNISKDEAEALVSILTDLATAAPAAAQAGLNAAKTNVSDKVEAVVEAEATALRNAKTAAGTAITTLIDSQESADITAAKSALEAAIDGCNSVEELAEYWTEADGLNTENALVADLAEAVQAAKDAADAEAAALPKAKAAALKAVDTLVGNTGSVDAVKTAKTALVNAINACTTIEADGEAATAKILATYGTYDAETDAFTLKVTQTQVAALKTAVENAATTLEAEATLKQAKIDAKDAINTAVGAYGNVDAVKTAVNTLVDLIDNCVVGGSAKTLITTFYENGALKATQDDVKAVLDAVAAAELAANKLTAIAAVDALFTEANVEKPEYDASTTSADTLQGKYSAVVKLINDCAVDGSSATALSTYWTAADGLKKTETNVAALIAKIEAAQA